MQYFDTFEATKEYARPMLDNGEDAALERYAEASEGRPLAPMTAYRFDGEVNDWVEGQTALPPHDSPPA